MRETRIYCDCCGREIEGVFFGSLQFDYKCFAMPAKGFNYGELCKHCADHIYGTIMAIQKTAHNPEKGVDPKI